MDFLDIGTIASIVSGALVVVSAVFGVKYRAAKTVLNDFSKAIEDDTLTKEELQRLWKDLNDLVN